MVYLESPPSFAKSAVYADPNGNGSGKSYVVFGKANNSAINLSDIANGLSYI
jgi:hypothetical protein